ncbi:hypothetical protein A8924_0054 [Saccharopolyspora erythraea NRRL 2338]|uniref:Uncharacterized protein n=2 Tax=Saccharopolyspora erythraea TaxID=1836 RepID=A4FQB0_SACEN|nr:DUF6221 family protein [Saccharopolyspora erythraea]EQD86318.1 hypothetical protein N599_10220 [Saccharopolyspora erythraea D]PFG92835.1 hypothetical protein A8924_0054 [Saccharopolyspora erythraea NRRL 2338]QRK89747.1 hypothetical protein JQX30_35430 [Saccharopolyspora erythraea]CAM06235.1 hypothetical protein SACE_7074 [Saccharopolyspora erythraea NRRL 2338]
MDIALVDFVRTRLDEEAAKIAGLSFGRAAAGERGQAASQDVVDRHLRTVDVKRFVLDECQASLRTEPAGSKYLAAVERAVTNLALEYAGHPEFREEWRP